MKKESKLITLINLKEKRTIECCHAEASRITGKSVYILKQAIKDDRKKTILCDHQTKYKEWIVIFKPVERIKIKRGYALTKKKR